MIDRFVENEMGTSQAPVRRALSAVVNCIRRSYNAVACAARKKRTKAVEAVKTCPQTLDEAFRGDDAPEWIAAADLEFDTLTEMGVIDHNYTYEQLVKLGLKFEPINMSVVLDNKLGQNNELLRRKVRMAIAGHKI